MYDQTKHSATDDDDRTILALLLDPGARGVWSADELAREINNPRAVSDALARLDVAGFIHRCGRFVFATRAAQSADEEEAARRAPTNADLGRALRRLRKARKLTIESLAFEADMHPTYLSGIERGVRNPTWIKLCALAEALSTSPAIIARVAEGSRERSERR